MSELDHMYCRTAVFALGRHPSLLLLVSLSILFHPFTHMYTSIYRPINTSGADLEHQLANKMMIARLEGGQVQQHDFCHAEKLTYPFRAVNMQQSSPAYKMFLHGPGRDTFISDSIFQSLSGGRYFEKDLQEQMEATLKGQKPDQTLILDIGANIGLHAIYFASKGFGVHAFEPAKANFVLLQCSKAANTFDNLVINNIGLSDNETDSCIDIDPTNHGGSTVADRFNCPPDNQISLKKLDDYYDRFLRGKRVYLLKIDVEGHELAALRGGIRIFGQSPPKYVFSEVNPVAMKKRSESVAQYFYFFWSYGYTIYRSLNGRLSEKYVKGGKYPSILVDIIAIHPSVNTTLV